MKTSSLSRRVRVNGRLGSRMSNGSKCLPTLGSFRAISMRLRQHIILQLRWDSLPSSYTVKRRWGDIQKQLGLHRRAPIRIISPSKKLAPEKQEKTHLVFSSFQSYQNPKIDSGPLSCQDLEVWRMNWPSSSFVSFGCSRRVLKTAVEKDANASTSASACSLLESKGDPAPKSLNSILTYRNIPQDTPSMYRALGPPVIARSDNT